MPVSRAMLEAGYPPTTAKNPQQLKRSKAWKELMEDHLSDKNLGKKHEALLEAATLEQVRFDAQDSDESIVGIISELPGYKLIHIRYDYINDKLEKKVAYVKAPDNQTQEKALDKAYKLKGRYLDTEQGASKTLVLVVSGETANRYVPTRHAKTSRE